MRSRSSKDTYMEMEPKETLSSLMSSRNKGTALDHHRNHYTSSAAARTRKLQGQPSLRPDGNANVVGSNISLEKPAQPEAPHVSSATAKVTMTPSVDVRVLHCLAVLMILQ